MENNVIREREKAIIERHGFKNLSRNFDPNKKISKEDMNFILEMGRLAPSSFGLEPWKFLVIEDEDVKKEIYETTPRLKNRLKNADKLVIILARNSHHLRYSSNYINYVLKEIKKVPSEAVQGVKNGIKELQDRETSSMYDMLSIYHWSWRQTYIALSFMVFAAGEIGVKAQPVEEYNEKDLEKVLVKAGALDRQDYSISVMVALGYPEGEERVERVRRPMEEVVQWV